jgi:hypothetical protein
VASLDGGRTDMASSVGSLLENRCSVPHPLLDLGRAHWSSAMLLLAMLLLVALLVLQLTSVHKVASLLVATWTVTVVLAVAATTP